MMLNLSIPTVDRLGQGIQIHRETSTRPVKLNSDEKKLNLNIIQSDILMDVWQKMAFTVILSTYDTIR